MKKFTRIILCLAALSIGLPHAFGEYVTPEFSRGGKVFRYVWKDFQDAQLMLKTDDQFLQILAIRTGELQQKAGLSFTPRWKVNGLWHAYQTPDKSWVSNGVVADLTTPTLEAMQSRNVFMEADVGEARLAAASDSAGRLHAVILGSSPGQGEKRFFYAVRDADNQWHVMLSDPLPDDLAEPFCMPDADGQRMMLLALAQGGSRIVKYTLTPYVGGGRDTFRWSREVLPENIRARSFAAIRDRQTFILFYQSSGDGSFKAADQDLASGKWILDPQRFEKSFEGNITRAAFKNLNGFLGRDGLPQVLGLYSGAEGVYHFYRDEIGLWHNNDVVLRVRSLKRISASPDGLGLFNASGVTTDGRIWHGYRSEGSDWRNNGLIFDSNSH